MKKDGMKIGMDEDGLGHSFLPFFFRARAPFSAVASTCFRGHFKGRLRAREVFAAVFTEASSSRAGGHPSPDAAARGKRLPAVSKHVTDQGRRPTDTCGRVGGQGQEAGSVRPARARGQLARARASRCTKSTVSGLKRPPTSSARTTSLQRESGRRSSGYVRSLARRACRRAAPSARFW